MVIPAPMLAGKFCIALFYSGTQACLFKGPPITLIPLGMVGARSNMRSSYSHQEPAITGIQTQALVVPGPVL